MADPYLLYSFGVQIMNKAKGGRECATQIPLLGGVPQSGGVAAPPQRTFLIPYVCLLEGYVACGRETTPALRQCHLVKRNATPIPLRGRVPRSGGVAAPPQRTFLIPYICLLEGYVACGRETTPALRATPPRRGIYIASRDIPIRSTLDSHLKRGMEGNWRCAFI